MRDVPKKTSVRVLEQEKIARICMKKWAKFKTEDLPNEAQKLTLLPSISSSSSEEEVGDLSVKSVDAKLSNYKTKVVMISIKTCSGK